MSLHHPVRRWAALIGFAALLAGGMRPAGASETCGGRDLRPLIAADASLSASLSADVAAMPFGEGKFFKITKPGLAPSWIYGTIHHGDARVTAFAPAMLAALDNARAVALEVAEAERLNDPETLKPVMSHVLAAMVARPAERADVLLPPPDVAVLERSLVAHGLPAAAVRTFRPTFLALALALPPCARAASRDHPAVDVLIARRSAGRGLPPVGLESLAAQFDAIASIPSAAQGPFLRSILAGMPYEEDVFETTTRLYVEGHLGWMLAWSRRGTIVPGIEAPAPPGFFEAMLDRRNLAMRDAALPLLARGGAFIAVGAAHLPGAEGLASLIKRAGYTVERSDGPTP